MPEQYDNRSSIQLWKPDSDNPKAPAAKGNFVAHRAIQEGETIEVALWRNDSDNPKAPVMKGKISDKREQTTAPQREPERMSPDEYSYPDEDESIPF